MRMSRLPARSIELAPILYNNQRDLYKASLEYAILTGRLADDGSFYFERFARFLRTALGTITHNANNAANATPPSTASISEPPNKLFVI